MLLKCFRAALSRVSAHGSVLRTTLIKPKAESSHLVSRRVRQKLCPILALWHVIAARFRYCPRTLLTVDGGGESNQCSTRRDIQP